MPISHFCKVLFCIGALLSAQAAASPKEYSITDTLSGRMFPSGYGALGDPIQLSKSTNTWRFTVSKNLISGRKKGIYSRPATYYSESGLLTEISAAKAEFSLSVPGSERMCAKLSPFKGRKLFVEIPNLYASMTDAKGCLSVSRELDKALSTGKELVLRSAPVSTAAKYTIHLDNYGAVRDYLRFKIIECVGLPEGSCTPGERYGDY